MVADTGPTFSATGVPAVPLPKSFIALPTSSRTATMSTTLVSSPRLPSVT
jgi:hypothetical protein